MSHLIKDLNEKQVDAVLATEGPLLVVAGAGSGKTRALTHRIAYLMQEKNVNPWNTLAVTFTNKAAKEMKERLRELLSSQTVEEAGDFIFEDFFNPNYEPQLPMMGTFHSICVRILRKHIHLLGYNNNFAIYDVADQNVLAKRLMQELHMDPKKTAPRAILSHISNAKNELITANEYERRSAHNMFTENVAKFYKRYQKELERSNALDFDDIIMLTVRLMEEHPSVLEGLQNKFRYISVDEYQDTNHAQYKLVTMLAAKYRNICVIGDSDQSIYSWRGADMRNILEFERDYPDARVVMLEQNYRSTQVILDAAHAVIEKNKSRRDKKLWTEKEGGEVIQIAMAGNEKEESAAIAREIQNIMRGYEFPDYRDFAVLYRTNAQSRTLEEMFLRYGIPYKIVGGLKFYERKEIKDVLAYLRVLVNPTDSVSLLRILNVPARNIGPKTVETVQRLAVRLGCSFFEALERADELAGGDAMERFGAKLSDAKVQSLKKFVDLIRKLQGVNRSFPASGVIKHVIDYTGYKRFLDDGSVEGEARLENVRELISVAAKYDSLEPGMSLNIFLEEVALIADVDRLDNEENSVTLMTVHSAKGLEFPVIFICGLEEGVFPHSRSLLDQRELEEERRLMYVAMTRAKERLYLLHAEERMLYGDYKRNAPSQFLDDIPEELIETNYESRGGGTSSNSAYGGYGSGTGRRVYGGGKPGGGYGDESKLGWSKQSSPGWTGGSSSSESDVSESEDLGYTPIPVEGPDVEDFVDELDVELRDGDKVAHEKFGEGIVVNVTGGIVTVAFKSKRYGVKKLALSIAPLRKIG